MFAMSSLSRDKDTNLLVENRAEQWDLKTSQAIIVIRNSEESRKLHSKQKNFLKPIVKGGIRSVLVPAPRTNVESKENNITNPETQCEFYDPQEVFNVLLRQNYRHLLKSEMSFFTKGSLMGKIGYLAEHEIVDEILEGLNIEEGICESHKEMGSTLQNFIRASAKIKNSEGKKIPDYGWTYGAEEYKETFKKTRETTTCGPSGLHMSHWKAACENNILATTHAFFIWAAFQFGFSYPRWEVSWFCMLLKKTSLLTKT